MTCRRSLQFLFFVSVFFLFQLFSACEKFSGDQTIPSYLKIDSIAFTSDYSLQGSSSHNITDAWVYVDGEFIGAFPLPADFPVLKQGSHKVEIMPGIKKDGIAATRSIYPFYNVFTKTVNLVPDVHTSAGAVSSTYESQTDFLWLEDFEGNLSLDTTKRSSVGIQLTSPGSDSTFERLHSGKIEMDSTNAFFECVSHQSFTVPKSDVFLEMDFNTNNSLTVSVLVFTGTVRYQRPVLILNNTNGKWKKIYIDLSNGINEYLGATLFQVMFGNSKDATGHAQILLDNIKLLTLKSDKKM